MKRIDDARLGALVARARAAERRRANDNLHPDLEDPVQRFLNAMEPGTYVRPHRHAHPARWEFFLALTGRAAVLGFDEGGRVVWREELSAQGPVRGVEIEPGAWHAVAALEPGTVLFECKPGPYRPVSDKDFAPWAPAEGEPGAAALERWYRTAGPGERWEG